MSIKAHLAEENESTQLSSHHITNSNILFGLNAFMSMAGALPHIHGPACESTS